MSAAAATDAGDAPKKKGSKKLIIIIVAVVLLLAAAGGGALFFMKKKAAEEEEGDAEGGGAHAKPKAAEVHKPAKKHDAAHPPVYVPLEPFTVNLADRDQDRYAQIGVTLEVDEQKTADEMKGYMPSIRNAILMVLSHKTAAELLAIEGKEQLADEIMREAVRPMGIEIDAEEEEPAGKARKKRRQPVYNPVQHVHFSSFIIQ